MQISILAIGKKHDPKLESAILHYSARLKRYASLDWTLLNIGLSSSMKEIDIRNIESAKLMNYINNDDTVVLLDETGQHFTSIELSEKMQLLKNSSIKKVVFIIGGSYGVNESIKERADVVWALSSLVFPHQLVRLLLVEQLYRAETILSGTQYHHT